MERTSLALDESLLEDAIEATGARTKKEAVEAGLRALIQMKQKELLLMTPLNSRCFEVKS
jgi:Arc/MetJ family transcription regulator